MHDNNHFDDQLRKQLRQAEMTPPPFVWENIALELARKRRRKMLAFSLAASVVAGGLVAGFWLNRSVEKPVAPAVEPAQNQMPIATSSNQNQAAELTNQTHSNEPVFENPAAILNENTNPLFSKNENPGQAKSAVSEMNNQPVFVKKNQAASFSGNKNSASQIIENESIEPSLTTKSDIENSVESTFSNSPKAAFSFKKWTEFDPFSNSLTSVELTAVARPKPAIRPFKQKKRKPDCPSFAERGTAIFLDIYASPDRAVKMLTISDTDKPGYLADRRNSEKQSFSWSAGVRAGVLLGGKFTLRAGLHYSQVHETFEYYDPEDLKFLVETNPVTGLPDTLQWIYGESYEKVFNRFGLLDLPVTFGTEIGRGRFGLSLHGGAAVNLLFWKRGKIISPENGEPATFTPGAKNEDPVFVKNAGLSLLAGAQGFWQVNKKTRLFVEPHYQHRLKTITLPGHPVDQKMGQAGISFGMTRLLK